jgi:peptidoglycan/LPS O-acetylase OafA/YrhL
VGTCIYRHFTGEASNKAIAALVSCVVLAAVAEVYCNYVLVKKDDSTERFTFWAVFLPWAAAYILLLGGYLLKSRKFPRPLVWLGAISYSVYLLHPLCLQVVPSMSNRGYYFVAMLALTLIISSITYWFVEKPSISFGKRVQLRLDAAKSPQTTMRAGEIIGSSVQP